MKHFLIALIGLSFSSLIFAQTDVVGTWEWSGAGCRDASLSSDSHITKGDLPQLGLSSGVIRLDHMTFTADGFFVETDEEKYTPSSKDAYTVTDNTITIGKPGGTSPVKFQIVDDEIILNFHQALKDLREKFGEDAIGGIFRDEDDPTVSEVLKTLPCAPGRVYVYVFSRID